MKLGRQTASLMNHMMSRATPIEPQVGMGATVLAWSDRYAGTITSYDGKTLVVAEDAATRTDKNDPMCDSQDYQYERNPNGRTWTFRLDRKGEWREMVANDQTKRLRMTSRGTGKGIMIGCRDKYHDYSF